MHKFNTEFFTVRMVFFGVIYHLHDRNYPCPSVGMLHIFLIGVFAILSCLIILELAIGIISSRGTIYNSRPRRSLRYFLYFRLLLILPELSWTALGTYWTFDDSSDCPGEDVVVVRIAILANWCLFFIFSVMVYCLFDPLGSLPLDGRIG